MLYGLLKAYGEACSNPNRGRDDLYGFIRTQLTAYADETDEERSRSPLDDVRPAAAASPTDGQLSYDSYFSEDEEEPRGSAASNSAVDAVTSSCTNPRAASQTLIEDVNFFSGVIAITDFQGNSELGLAPDAAEVPDSLWVFKK